MNKIEINTNNFSRFSKKLKKLLEDNNQLSLSLSEVQELLSKTLGAQDHHHLKQILEKESAQKPATQLSSLKINQSDINQIKNLQLSYDNLEREITALKEIDEKIDYENRLLTLFIQYLYEMVQYKCISEIVLYLNFDEIKNYYTGYCQVIAGSEKYNLFEENQEIKKQRFSLDKWLQKKQFKSDEQDFYHQLLTFCESYLITMFDLFINYRESLIINKKGIVFCHNVIAPYKNHNIREYQWEKYNSRLTEDRRTKKNGLIEFWQAIDNLADDYPQVKQIDYHPAIENENKKARILVVAGNRKLDLLNPDWDRWYNLSFNEEIADIWEEFCGEDNGAYLLSCYEALY